MESLARRATEGDAVALNRLLGLVRPRVLGICSGFLPNREDAEEACQDSLTTVARKIATFEGRSKFTTWLTTLTANAARDTYARLKRTAQPAEAPKVEQADPRRTSVIAGTHLDFLDALEQIDPIYAEAVVLRDICGLEYAEIAEELGIPVGTVKSRIAEGRRLLRALLGR